jgi:hypothetical protein
MGLVLCAAHLGSVDDYLTDEGWRLVVATLRAYGKRAPDRALTTVRHASIAKGDG